jgi:hypothetical protein
LTVDFSQQSQSVEDRRESRPLRRRFLAQPGRRVQMSRGRSGFVRVQGSPSRIPTENPKGRRGRTSSTGGHSSKRDGVPGRRLLPNSLFLIRDRFPGGPPGFPDGANCRNGTPYTRRPFVRMRVNCSRSTSGEFAPFHSLDKSSSHSTPRRSDVCVRDLCGPDTDVHPS